MAAWWKSLFFKQSETKTENLVEIKTELGMTDKQESVTIPFVQPKCEAKFQEEYFRLIHYMIELAEWNNDILKPCGFEIEDISRRRNSNCCRHLHRYDFVKKKTGEKLLTLDNPCHQFYPPVDEMIYFFNQVRDGLFADIARRRRVLNIQILQAMSETRKEFEKIEQDLKRESPSDFLLRALGGE